MLYSNCNNIRLAGNLSVIYSQCNIHEIGIPEFEIEEVNTVLASNGTKIKSIEEMDHLIDGVNNELLFHHKNTDLCLLLLINQNPDSTSDDYTVKYIVTDMPSGKNFVLVEQIKVVTMKDFCSMPIFQERSDCKSLLNPPKSSNHSIPISS